MPLILAIEPDRRQAAQVTTIARGMLHVELVLAESSERALAALGSRVPDLILTSAFLSPKDEAALADRLRELDSAAAHVQTLTIPVLAAPKGRGSSSGSGVLSRLRKGSRKGAAPDGCDPKVFAEQVGEYLERARADRAAAAARAADDAELSSAAIRKPAAVAQSAPDPIAEFVADPVATEPISVAPEPAYVAPEPPYVAPEPPYVAPEPPYVAPEPTYVAPEPTYVAPEPTYVAPEPTYVAPEPTYTAPEPEPEPAPIALPEPAPLIAPEPVVFAADATAVEAPAVEEPLAVEDVPPPVSIDALLAQLVSAAPLQPEVAPEPIAHEEIAPPPVVEESQPAIASEPELAAAPAIEEAHAEPQVETSEIDLSAFLQELRASIEAPATAARAAARTIDAPPPPAPVVEPAAPLDQEPVFAAAPPPEPAAPPVEPTAPPLEPTAPLLEPMVPEVEASAAALEAAAPIEFEAPAEPLVSTELSAHDLAAFEEALAEPPSPQPVAAKQPEPPPIVTPPRVVPRPPVVTLPPVPVIAPRPVAAAPEPVRVGPPRPPVAAARSTPAPVATPVAAAKPEWADLLDALRREVDHLRTERAQSAPVDESTSDTSARATARVSGKNRASKNGAGKKKKRQKVTPTQDEWGFFDPEQCGFAALLAKLDEISEDDDVPQPA